MTSTLDSHTKAKHIASKMEGESGLRASSISSLNAQQRKPSTTTEDSARLGFNYCDMNLAKYYQSQYVTLCKKDAYDTKRKSISNLGENESKQASNIFYMNDSQSQDAFDLNYSHYGQLHTNIKDTFAQTHNVVPCYSSSNLFRPTHKLQNVKSAQNNKCCFNLCHCSKRCQSDSSIWSLSEPDLTQALCHAKNELDHNRLGVNVNEDQYGHLTRVITPPNAFLSQEHVARKPGSSEHVSYSNKLTQTDARYVSVKDRRLKLRQLSLAESPASVQQIYQTEASRHSMNTEHIYHTICEQQQLYNKLNMPEASKLIDSLNEQAYAHSLRQAKHANDAHIRLRSTNSQSLAADFHKFDYSLVEPEHKMATSKNGLPCQCNQCREARGLNLTTELLPLDAQLSMHTMDNFDSFLQDSSMAELICTIL